MKTLKDMSTSDIVRICYVTRKRRFSAGDITMKLVENNCKLRLRVECRRRHPYISKWVKEARAPGRVTDPMNRSTI